MKTLRLFFSKFLLTKCKFHDCFVITCINVPLQTRTTKHHKSHLELQCTLNNVLHMADIGINMQYGYIPQPARRPGPMPHRSGDIDRRPFLCQSGKAAVPPLWIQTEAIIMYHHLIEIMIGGQQCHKIKGLLNRSEAGACN